MGVYHLMGLGRSPGAVSGPLSYLAHRYQRWNADDQRFFARSGEQAQRQRGEKVGDVQALVLFSTSEVLDAKEEGKPFLASSYIENEWGKIIGKEQTGRPMKAALRGLLKRVWPLISGGRKTGTIFWCKVDRRSIRDVYERAAPVVAALAGAGGQGKEMWANLTGGNNVTNFALELAATLSGGVARLYYVQAQNPTAEKCAYFTAEEGYWVDLPVMPLALGRLRKEILNLLAGVGPLSLKDLYSRLRNDYFDLSRGLDSEQTLKEEYLTPMWKQGLIAGDQKVYSIGSQWELIQPYEQLWQQARQADLTLDQLAQCEPWIEREELLFD